MESLARCFTFKLGRYRKWGAVWAVLAPSETGSGPADLTPCQRRGTQQTSAAPAGSSSLHCDSRAHDCEERRDMHGGGRRRLIARASAYNYFFSIESRLALNSERGFHSGNLSPLATW
jgi:hypothetical protein